MMTRSSALIAFLGFTIIYPFVARGDIVEGAFIDEIVFHVETYPGHGYPSTTVLGVPDGLAPDINGEGGYTLRFGQSDALFDYTSEVVVPVGTDLILTEATIYTNADFELKYGYSSSLVDADDDGYADNPGGTPLLLGTVSLEAPPWMDWWGSRLWFFDLDQDPSFPFLGVTDDFFVAVNDTNQLGDSLDLDAIQVVVPEASSAWILIAGSIVVLRRRKSGELKPNGKRSTPRQLLEQRSQLPFLRSVLILALISGSNAALADPPSFQGLGDLPGGGFVSGATAISANGQAVVGTSESSTGTEAFHWTASGGIVGLGYLPSGNLFSAAYGISGDGSVVVGSGRFSPGSSQLEAFRWTEATGMVGLGFLPDANPAQFRSNAYGVSADGITVIGESVGYGSSTANAFRWTEGGGMVSLREPGLGSKAYGTSPDGSVIVGNADFGGSSAGEAFLWSAADGMIGLGRLPGADDPSVARAVSADGWTIVGESRSPNAGGSNFREAFRWTLDDAMVGLGDLPGGEFHSLAKAISGDGSVIIGSGTTESGAEAFIWTDAAGMRPLQDLLVDDLGLDLGGFSRLLDATGISADGLTIVGTGINADGNTEAFIARIPEPSSMVLLAAGSLVVFRRRSL